MARFSYWAAEPGGRYTITAAADGAPTVIDTIVVGYPLTHLRTYANYVFTGDSAIHPDAHYASLLTDAALRALSDSVAAHGLGPLGVNDESLSLGGLFDLRQNWAAPRHCSHRDGVGADVRNKVFSRAQKRWLRDTWDRILGSDGSAPETDHLHLKVKR